MLLRPSGADWEYVGHQGTGAERMIDKVKMRRIQIPLAPEKDRTVQTAQGLTMDSAIMYLARPSNMSFDDWWLHVYVMLSRVRTLDQVLVYGLPPRELFERGPPAYIRAGLERLEEMGKACVPLLEAARVNVGWASEVGDAGRAAGEAR